MTSYDEDSAFDGEGSHNLAMTVDLIVKIPNEHKGRMTQAHLLSSTIAGQIHDVLGNLEDLINTANCVVLCKHDLSTDYFNREEVYVHIKISPSKLPTLTYSPNINWVFHRIKNNYLNNYDDVTLVQKEPTIVFCTSVYLVRVLKAYLKSIAHNKMAKSEKWNKAFMEFPNAETSQYREALHHCFLYVPLRECDPWDGGANGRLPLWGSQVREMPARQLYSAPQRASRDHLMQGHKRKAEHHDTYNRHEYLWKQLYSNVAAGRLHDMERPPEAELKEVVAAIRAIAVQLGVGIRRYYLGANLKGLLNIDDDEDANELNFLTDLEYAVSVKAAVDYFPLYVAAISKKDGHLFAYSTATLFGPAFLLAHFLDLILSTGPPAPALRPETYWVKRTRAHHPILHLGVDTTRMSAYVVGELLPGKLIEERMDDISWNSAVPSKKLIFEHVRQGGFDEVTLRIDQRSSKHTYNIAKTGHVLLKRHLDNLGLASRATRTRVKDPHPNMLHNCVATYNINTDALKDTVGFVVLMMTDSHIAAMQFPDWTALFDGTEAHIAERVREALEEGEEDDSCPMSLPCLLMLGREVCHARVDTMFIPTSTRDIYVQGEGAEQENVV
ncbi:hypothetical protein BDK51DRAFT_28514 [Blyttiomyces helicus]|uniref:Uncharacterized protein n=1 Tax=Blyttiomyces helicus TaxID=388810 RepID=A0A4V1ISC2_9FUNG|nr:hypothetical protein BDK51DRAFT_28514 [Blyttiomyces helicus]|eukprot:RKO93047.1 hypothetical protein BDK51DRAFT_28514 [Blyttiomyces helicus]